MLYSNLTLPRIIIAILNLIIFDYINFFSNKPLNALKIKSFNWIYIQTHDLEGIYISLSTKFEMSWV